MMNAVRNLGSKVIRICRLERRPVTPLFFLHVPKTAGMSVITFLQEQYQREGVYAFEPPGAPGIPDELPRAGCYLGHAGYGITKKLPPSTRVFVILRDPLERALSAYYYFRRLPRVHLERYAPALAHTHEMSLPEIFKAFPEPSKAMFGNVQTAILSWCEKPFRQESMYSANLDRARDNLRKCMVGVTERLTESLACLGREMRLALPTELPQVNRTPDRPKAAELDVEARSIVEEHTQLDRRLYQDALQLFEQWHARVLRNAA